MYAANYPIDHGEKKAKKPSIIMDKGQDKVTYICNAMLTKMKQMNKDSFRLPMLTIYVKLKQTEKALDMIWSRRMNPLSEGGGGGGGVKPISRNDQETAYNELRHLMYLVDINELYDVALGTYDFGLVMFVAQYTMMDPKEYLPFLNELKSYEANYRRFKIDEYLKRWKKALQFITKCGEEKLDEAIEFIKRRKCYNEALRTYRNNEKCYSAVCLAFADHLRESGKLEEASLLYERGGNLEQALLSSKNALDWQRTMILTSKLKTPEELIQTAK